MLNFSFYNPTKILFGKGQIAKIGKEIPKDQRILLTYGGAASSKTAFMIRSWLR
jgi:NADP-dependent alcohol dehydrogenase